MTSSDRPAGAPAAWGPKPGWAVGCTAVLLASLAWLALARSLEDRLVAGMLALAAAAALLVWQRLRYRLAADANGLVVGTLWARRRLGWAVVDEVRAAPAGRFGRRVFVLEIEVRPPGAADPLDNELLVFGRIDLGADPTEVTRALKALQQR